MSSSSPVESFSTFHSRTAAVATEITTHIIKYVIPNTQSLLLGGGFTAHKAYPPVASVSRTFRSIYLSQHHPVTLRDKATASVKFMIGECLEFSDLRTLATFFCDGPGQDSGTLHRVRFLSVSYRDNDTFTSRWQLRTEYAYEAFEILYNQWQHMQISLLQLHLPFYRTIASVDDAGIWSLLKIRGLKRLSILGPYGCINPQVRTWLKVRTHQKKLFPWRPLGTESPGPGNWTDLVRYQGNQWHEQYERLDVRYKYLHDRETVTVRCIKQRAAYQKQHKRYPMLLKRRRKRAISNLTTSTGAPTNGKCAKS